MNITMTYKGHKPSDWKDLQVTQYNYDQVKVNPSPETYDYDQDYWSTVDEYNEKKMVTAATKAANQKKREQQWEEIKKSLPTVETAPYIKDPHNTKIPKSARKLTKKTKKSPLPKTATTVLPSQVNRKRKSYL